MPRNFHRRVEVIFPIEDAALKARLVDEVLATELADDTKAAVLGADGRYTRLTPGTNPVRAQSVFLDRARASASRADQVSQTERPFVVKPVRRSPTMASPSIPVEAPDGEGRISNVDGFPAAGSSPGRDPSAS
jgi:polyphosphate kinase